MELKGLQDSKNKKIQIKIKLKIFFTLIKTSGCSKPASRVSIRKYVSSDAGIPL
jgi:hypothetical protein